MQVTIYKVYEGDNTKQCVSPSSFYLTVILFHLSIIFHTHTERCILLLLFVHLFVVILPFKYLFLWLYFCPPQTLWLPVGRNNTDDHSPIRLLFLGKFTDCHKLISLAPQALESTPVQHRSSWNEYHASIRYLHLSRYSAHYLPSLLHFFVCQSSVSTDHIINGIFTVCFSVSLTAP